MRRKPAHTPIRQCSGCDRRDPQRELDRFTVSEGRLVWAKRAGRGAYLHRTAECRQALLSRKPSIRSLRASFSKQERASFLGLKKA